MAKKVTESKKMVQEPIEVQKTYIQPDIIKEDFESKDEEIIDEIEDPLFQDIQKPNNETLDEEVEVNFEKVVIAAKILIHNLDGIFIGGHATQAKDNLNDLIKNF